MTREKLIEALARALCSHEGYGWVPQFGDQWRAKAQAALQAIEDAGYAVVPVERFRAELERAVRNVLSVETESMCGDNLAVTLCTYFENPDQEETGEGWTPDALEAYEEIKTAIDARFAVVRSMLEAAKP